MHSLRFGETVFNYNSDLSGDVDIRREGKFEVSVPGTHLLAFVAEYVRGRAVAELEDMPAYELLGVPPFDTED